MTNRSFPKIRHRGLRSAVSTALAVGLLTGCASAGPHPSKLVASAQTALDKGQPDRAVGLAEQAVSADGRNASLRLLLANAYMRAGRFESARQTFEDATQLGEDGAKAALSMALADIAMGHQARAVDTLNTWRDGLPAADLGLALAMAGQTREGVSVLTDALRRGENTPKVRQNLAFAYALDGSWLEARIMASQDVPADKLGARMQEWAAMGRPEDNQLRVANLLGVPMREDAGQPTALALANFPAEGGAVQQARAEAAAPELAQAAPAQELPAVAPAQATVAVPSVMDAPAPAAPARLSMVDVAASQTSAPEHFIAKRPVEQATGSAFPMTRVSYGSHLVQLGAFSSETGAKRAWRHYAARIPALGNHSPVISKVSVNGRTLWRVRAAGFTGFASARTTCGSVKARGGACLVMVSPRMKTTPQHMVEARFARR